VSESAESAKRGWAKFGAKPAQSETTVRAAAKRRSTRWSTEWKEDVKLPLRFYLSARSPSGKFKSCDDRLVFRA
jgi:hypothetical protein